MDVMRQFEGQIRGVLNARSGKKRKASTADEIEGQFDDADTEPPLKTQRVDEQAIAADTPIMDRTVTAQKIRETISKSSKSSTKVLQTISHIEYPLTTTVEKTIVPSNVVVTVSLPITAIREKSIPSTVIAEKGQIYTVLNSESLPSTVLEDKSQISTVDTLSPPFSIIGAKPSTVVEENSKLTTTETKSLPLVVMAQSLPSSLLEEIAPLSTSVDTKYVNSTVVEAETIPSAELPTISSSILTEKDQLSTAVETKSQSSTVVEASMLTSMARKSSLSTTICETYPTPTTVEAKSSAVFQTMPLVATSVQANTVMYVDPIASIILTAQPMTSTALMAEPIPSFVLEAKSIPSQEFESQSTEFDADRLEDASEYDSETDNTDSVSQFTDAEQETEGPYSCPSATAVSVGDNVQTGVDVHTISNKPFTHSSFANSDLPQIVPNVVVPTYPTTEPSVTENEPKVSSSADLKTTKSVEGGTDTYLRGEITEAICGAGICNSELADTIPTSAPHTSQSENTVSSEQIGNENANENVKTNMDQDKITMSEHLDSAKIPSDSTKQDICGANHALNIIKESQAVLANVLESSHKTNDEVGLYPNAGNNTNTTAPDSTKSTEINTQLVVNESSTRDGEETVESSAQDEHITRESGVLPSRADKISISYDCKAQTLSSTAVILSKASETTITQDAGVATNTQISEYVQAATEQNKYIPISLPLSTAANPTQTSFTPFSSLEQTSGDNKQGDDVILVNVTEEKLYLPPTVLPSPRTPQQTHTLAQRQRLTVEPITQQQRVVHGLVRQTGSSFQNVARTNVMKTPTKASDDGDVICISDDVTYVDRTQGPPSAQVHETPKKSDDVICIVGDVTYVDKSSKKISITPIKSNPPAQHQRIQQFSASQQKVQPQHQTHRDDLQYTPTKHVGQGHYPGLQTGSQFSSPQRGPRSDLDLYEDQYTPTKQISHQRYTTQQAAIPRQSPQSNFVRQCSPVREWGESPNPSPVQHRQQPQQLFTPPKNVIRPQVPAQQRYFTPPRQSPQAIPRVLDEGVEIVGVTPPKSKVSLFSSGQNTGKKQQVLKSQSGVQQYSVPQGQISSPTQLTQQSRVSAETMQTVQRSSQQQAQVSQAQRMLQLQMMRKHMDKNVASGQRKAEFSHATTPSLDIPPNVAQMKPETLQQFIAVQRHQVQQRQAQMYNQQLSRASESLQVKPTAVSAAANPASAGNQQRQHQSSTQEPSRVAETFQIKPATIAAGNVGLTGNLQRQPQLANQQQDKLVETQPIKSADHTPGPLQKQPQISNVKQIVPPVLDSKLQSQVATQQSSRITENPRLMPTGASGPKLVPVAQTSSFIPIKREIISPVRETELGSLPKLSVLPATTALPKTAPVTLPAASPAVSKQSAMRESMALVMSDVAVQQASYRESDQQSTQLPVTKIKQEPIQETITETHKSLQMSSAEPARPTPTGEIEQPRLQNVATANVPAAIEQRRRSDDEVDGVSIEIDNALQDVKGTPLKIAPEGLTAPFSPQQRLSSPSLKRPFSPQSRRPSHELVVHTEPDTSGWSLTSPDLSPRSSTSSDGGKTKTKTKRGRKPKSAIKPGYLPFSCGLCDKTFASKTGLTKHEKTHSGEKPFKCDICGKGYTSKGSLKVHIHSHFKSKE